MRRRFQVLGEYNTRLTQRRPFRLTLAAPRKTPQLSLPLRS